MIKNRSFGVDLRSKMAEEKVLDFAFPMVPQGMKLMQDITTTVGTMPGVNS